MPGLRFETTAKEAAVIEQAVVEMLRKYARDAGWKDPIVRDLLPNEDLKGAGVVLSGHVWAQSVSSLTHVTIYSGENDENRAFAIFKVANGREDPLTVAIRFWDGTGRTALKDIWQTEHAWLSADCQAYCDEKGIIFYGKKTGFNIDLMARKLSKVLVDKVIFGGKVVEPSGKTISPMGEKAWE